MCIRDRLPPVEKKKKKEDNNEKLNRLKEVFGIDPSAPEEPAPQEKPEEKIAEDTQALEEAVKEIEEIKIPVPPVEAVRSAITPSAAGQSGTPVPEEVKTLTEEFLKKREESVKREEASPEQKALYTASELSLIHI